VVRLADFCCALGPNSKRGGAKQREWKPYSKMTWEERAAREKKEEERAWEKVGMPAACLPVLHSSSYA
jgi:hypothetical protein